MNLKPKYLLLFCCFLTNLSFAQQKVGLVLSGGGATGFAHIGVIQALEENNIPIDYITGTSAGALVGAMYATGYSPQQMKDFVLSKEFLAMSQGKLLQRMHFLYREEDETASMFDLKFGTKDVLRKALPTNLRKSDLLDYQMMEMFGTVGASVNNEFDSLFVPFRCVAADIVKKEPVVFCDGSLNQAVRASMTYPFFIRPLFVNGKLLFDGGLYNNFPSNVMVENFSPDFIIGCNVSGNSPPPTDDDLFSQLDNMMSQYSTYKIPMDSSFMIEPKTEVGSFGFDDVKKAIEDGYNSTILVIDSLKQKVSRRASVESLQLKRSVFKTKITELNVSKINVLSDKKNSSYIQKSMLKTKKNEVISSKILERRYFRMNAAKQIKFIYPTLKLASDSTYELQMNVKHEKPFELNVGGHFSTRAVTTGYLGLNYQYIGKIAVRAHVETYFGKFYTSGATNVELEVPSRYPFSIEPYFVFNKWDYFRNFVNFFEEERTSFLVQNEIYSGLKINLPITNTFKSTIDTRFFETYDNYYQDNNFTNLDTTDFTRFNGFSVGFELKQNSLNRKQFASSGHFLSVKLRYVNGKEFESPGSTSSQIENHSKYHEWLNISAKYQSFVVNIPWFHLGLEGQVAYNTVSLFNNETSSRLTYNEFDLVPDVTSAYYGDLRAPQFLAVGGNLIFTPFRNFDIRLDGYYFQPILSLRKDQFGALFFEKFKDNTFLVSSSLVYNSFLGPLRATLNYLPFEKNPLFFQLSFGYTLMNKRAYRN